MQLLPGATIGPVERSERVEDRCERVAQLVCDQGEEFVLAAIRLEQRLLAASQRLLHARALDEIRRLAQVQIEPVQLFLARPVYGTKVRGDCTEWPAVEAQERG